MMTTWRTLLIVVNLALASQAQAQVRDAGVTPRPTGTATITGIVRSADETNTPVRLVRVTLNSLDRGGAAQTVTTDAAGRFAFRGLPAGRYSIQASKRAWIDANYGASKVGRAGTPVAVSNGETVSNLTIRLTRGAVIAGAVRDANGEPQAGIQVRVMRFVTRDGLRALERPSSMNLNDPVTDDDGAFRVYGLPPGEYIVVAAIRFGDANGLGGQEFRTLTGDEVDRSLAAPPNTTLQESRGALVANAPVFFPGTTDMSAASTITLNAGEERTGIDLPFAYFPTARVSGTVALPPLPPEASGERSRRAELRITPHGFEDLLVRPLAASVAEVSADGRFVFAGVPPGSYTVTAVTGSPSGNVRGGVSGPTVGGWSYTSVVVSGQDQEISVPMLPGATVKGRVVFEGDAPPKDPSQEVQIQARGLGRARLLRPDLDARPAAEDGTFSFGAIVGGRWKFQASVPPSSRWSLKSMTLGGRELEDYVEVDGGVQLPELVFTFTDKPSELTGSLLDTAGRPASDYFVIAFSADRGAWTPVSRRILSARPASDGAFTIKGLPAGEYYLAALTDVEPNEWLSPAFLEQIVPASVRVQIADGVRTTQSLRIAR